jgi:hypothetical protein
METVDGVWDNRDSAAEESSQMMASAIGSFDLPSLLVVLLRISFSGTQISVSDSCRPKLWDQVTCQFYRRYPELMKDKAIGQQ